MQSALRWSSARRLFRSSLYTKIIAWFFVPTAIILIMVALVNFYAYQNVTADLVIERDQELTRLAAGQLTSGLTEFSSLLNDIVRNPYIATGDRASQQLALQSTSIRNRLIVFDGGTVILNTFGRVVATQPNRPALLGDDWSDRSFFRQMVRSAGPAVSNVFDDEAQGVPLVAQAAPITSPQGEFLGALVGMFRLSPDSVNALYASVVQLRIGESGATYLVDANGRVIYHSNPDYIGDNFLSQPVVEQALSQQVGASRTQNLAGEDIVAGYAPVPNTAWGLVGEETWASLSSEASDYQRFLVSLLILGATLPALFVAVGIQRVMRPLRALTNGAQRIASGDFEHTIETQTKNELQDLAQQFNMMAAALKESYEELEQRVEDRTKELQVSEKKYRSLFEQSRDAIFITNSEGKIVDANQGALDLFGFTRAEAIGSDVAERYVDLADRERFREEIRITGSVSVFELKLRRKDGAELDCLLSATLRLDEQGNNQGVQGIIHDITERKRAEEAVRERDARYRAVAESAVEAIITADSNGHIMQWNRAAQAIFGYTGPEIIGQPAGLLLPEEDQEELRRALDRFRSTGDAEIFRRVVESKGRRKDGNQFPMEVSLSHWRARDEIFYSAIIRDITERKESEEALFEQTRELAVLGERNRMAREIHDTLAQGFTGIVLQLEAAEQAMEEDQEETLAHLGRAKTLARDSLQEARRSVWNLLPKALEEHTLDVALQEEINKFAAAGREQAVFGQSGEKRDLPPNIQTTLLRICQESLNNVRKHANASTVKVSLDFSLDGVRLGIQDNGKGIDFSNVKGVSQQGGFGLIAMEQRVRQVGGNLSIKSKTGEGTLIEVTVPGI